jgi:hypothetical protein
MVVAAIAIRMTIPTARADEPLRASGCAKWAAAFETSFTRLKG